MIKIKHNFFFLIQEQVTCFSLLGITIVPKKCFKFFFILVLHICVNIFLGFFYILTVHIQIFKMFIVFHLTVSFAKIYP